MNYCCKVMLARSKLDLYFLINMDLWLNRPRDKSKEELPSLSWAALPTYYSIVLLPLLQNSLYMFCFYLKDFMPPIATSNWASIS